MEITNLMAYDCESALIDAGLLAPPLACVTYCDHTLVPTLSYWSDSFEPLRAMLQTKNMVGANIAFDMAVISAQFPELLPLVFEAYEENRVADVRLNQRLIDLARGCLDGSMDSRGVYHKRTYSLDALSQLYGFGKMDKDSHRLKYGEYRQIPLQEWPDGAVEYAKLDAKRTFEVFVKQLEFSEFLGDAAAQARAAFALHLMSCRGIVTDEKACQNFIAQTKAEIEAAKKTLQDAGLVDSNGKRKMKLARVYMEKVCHERALTVPKTKRGKDAKAGWTPSTCLDAEACRDTGDEVLKAYSTYTSANTLVKKAEILIKGSQGIPLQTSFETLLETGRTSSRAPMPPMVGDNFQNVRRAPGMRECFVPRPGFLLVSVDYSMAELRTFAQICLWVLGQSEMAKALNAGLDVHCVLAANMMNKPYEWVVANKKDPEVKRFRQLSKAGNFGKIGGLGIDAFVAYCAAMGVKITKEEAAKVDRAFKTTWSETPAYFKWVSSNVGDGVGTYKSFISGRVRAHLNFSTFANNGFQSLAADAAKSALLPIAAECYVQQDSPLFGSRPLLFIHDEVLAEIPEHKAHEAAFRLRDLMVQHFNRYVPDVPVTAEPAMARRWYKDMETVLDSHGRLQCWEPAA